MITREQHGIGALPLVPLLWATGGATVLYGLQEGWGKVRDFVVNPEAIRPAPAVRPSAPSSAPTMSIPQAWNPDEMWGQTVRQQQQVNAAFNAGAAQSARVFESYFGGGADASALSPWLFAALAALGVAVVMR